MSLFRALCLLALLQVPVPRPPEPVSQSTFVGTWVGLQTWSTDSTTSGATPGVQEGQTVTLTIDLVDGKLTGFLNPFFGGSDGASFVDAQIVGEELRASAVIGRPPAAGGRGGRGGRGGAGWKNDTTIQFTLKADRTHMTGAAQVELGGVRWMRYNYDLEKKRSRY
jgi:hypothetical protein